MYLYGLTRPIKYGLICAAGIVISTAAYYQLCTYKRKKKTLKHKQDKDEEDIVPIPRIIVDENNDDDVLYDVPLTYIEPNDMPLLPQQSVDNQHSSTDVRTGRGVVLDKASEETFKEVNTILGNAMNGDVTGNNTTEGIAAVENTLDGNSTVDNVTVDNVLAENTLEEEIEKAENHLDEQMEKTPCEDEDDGFSEQKASRKILLLGLDNCGKSSLLSQLSKEGTNCLEYEPTKGFNVVCISFETIDLSIWEIGGGESYRTYWKNFSATTDLILFVVDSSQPEKFPVAKKYFSDIIDDLNDDIDFRIIATKSDLPSSVSVDDVRNGLGLDGMEWDILKVAATSGGAAKNIGIEQVQSFCLNV